MASPRSVFWRLALLCASVRIMLQAVGLATLSVRGQPVWSNAIGLWSSWDADHYLRIAEVGYRSGRPPPDDPLFIVFFPFFPLAVRIVSVVVRDLIVSGLVVSFAASVGAGWFLYRLVAIDAPEDEAWRAVLLLYAFPTAYYLATPYTEALFLFAVVASVYAARTGAWGRAGLAGALATGTRVTGIALAPALVAEAFRDRAGGAARAKRMAWIAVAGAGLLIYLAINQIVHGEPFWFMRVQRSHWFQEPVAPWNSVIEGVQALLEGTRNSTRAFIFAGRTAAFAFALPLLLIGVKRLRLADSLYAWTGFVLILSTSWLISLPRYLLVLYPFFIVGARITRPRVAFLSVVVVGWLVQVALFSRYAVGEWTF